MAHRLHGVETDGLKACQVGMTMKRLFAAWMAGALGACAGAGLIIAVCMEIVGLVQGNPLTLSSFATGLVVATLFSTLLGFLPAAVAVLVIGLPVHSWLSKVGRTTVPDYALAGGAAGLCIAALILVAGRVTGGSGEVWALGVVGGSIVGAVAFRITAEI